MHPWNLEEFSELLCELSPENLHCDGEISVSEANRKYKKLMTQWRKLEKDWAGNTVKVRSMTYYEKGESNELSVRYEGEG